MTTVSLEEARTILGDMATEIDDKSLESLIIFIETLCSKIIQDVTKQNETKDKITN